MSQTREVSRRSALAGGSRYDAPFKRCSQPMKLLAGLEMTPKKVGARRKPSGKTLLGASNRRSSVALQADLPVAVGRKNPNLYCKWMRAGCPSSRRKRRVGPSKTEGQPAHTRGQVGICLHPNEMGGEGVTPFGIQIRPPTRVIETVEEFGKRLYLEAWKWG